MKTKRPVNYDYERLYEVYRPMKFIASDEERNIYNILIREFPELKKRATIFNDEGDVGLVFTPSSTHGKWRNLIQIYREYLPELNLRMDRKLYDNILTEFIDVPRS